MTVNKIITKALEKLDNPKLIFTMLHCLRATLQFPTDGLTIIEPTSDCDYGFEDGKTAKYLKKIKYKELNGKDFCLKRALIAVGWILCLMGLGLMRFTRI